MCSACKCKWISCSSILSHVTRLLVITVQHCFWQAWRRVGLPQSRSWVGCGNQGRKRKLVRLIWWLHFVVLWMEIQAASYKQCYFTQSHLLGVLWRLAGKFMHLTLLVFYINQARQWVIFHLQDSSSLPEEKCGERRMVVV